MRDLKLLASFACAAAVAVPGSALADNSSVSTTGPAVNDTMLHVNVGPELGMGGGVISWAFRVHAGASRSWGQGHVRPAVALGLTAAVGKQWADAWMPEPQSAAAFDIGPELQVGLRIGDGGVADNRVFATVAPLATRRGSQLAMALPNNDTLGMRVSVGVNWGPVMWQSLVLPAGHAKEDVGLLFMLVPEQLEMQWQREAGNDLFGVTLGWGL